LPSICRSGSRLPGNLSITRRDSEMWEGPQRPDNEYRDRGAKAAPTFLRQ